MKVKLALVVVVLLALALFFYNQRGNGRDAAPDTVAVSTHADTAPADSASAVDAPPAKPEAPVAAARPMPDEVLELAVGSGDGALRLERSHDGWDVVGAVSAPADAGKVDHLLSCLLSARMHPADGESRAVSGLEDADAGLPVKLVTADRSAYEMRVGLRPEGSFGSTYVRLPGGDVEILSADIRGDLGLWKNDPDAAPDPTAWLKKEALTFEPGRAVRLEAVYPDHRIVFERPDGGDWEQRGYIPGGEWDREALEKWLRDLSRFQISGISGTGDLPKDPQKSHSVKITLDDGSEKAVHVAANHAGEGMLVESSDFPGHVFHLPEWRFRKYFRRLPSLFPKAVPHFDLADIRFIDVRQGGETVKIANKDNAWHAATATYPLCRESVDRLAGMLSTWRPEDYAAPDFKAVRPLFAGPMIEVILAGGTVHQYRLAGRHPLFPWRYVILDNAAIFSITDAEAGVMFPGLAEVLELGRVLPETSADAIDAIRLEESESGSRLELRRRDDDAWEAGADDHWIWLSREESEYILNELLDWSVAGFYNLDARPDKPTTMYQLWVRDKDGTERAIQFLEPDERDIPYLAEGIIKGHRAFLLDRKEFFNWLGAMRGLGERIHLNKLHSARKAAEAAEAAEAEKKQQEEETARQQDQFEAEAATDADPVDVVSPERVSPETPVLEVEDVASETEQSDEPEQTPEASRPEEAEQPVPAGDDDAPVAASDAETDANVDWEHVDPVPAEQAEPVPETDSVAEPEPVEETAQPAATDAIEQPPVEEPSGEPSVETVETVTPESAPEPETEERGEQEDAGSTADVPAPADAPELVVPEDGEVPVVIPPVADAPTAVSVESEPPLHIPLSEPAQTSDSDLVQPPVPSEHDVDIFAEGAGPVDEAVVDRFVDNYIGDAPEAPQPQPDE